MTTTTGPILPAELEDLVARFEVRRSDAPTPADERASLLAAPKFGTVFSDHMARISWRSDDGWTGRRVEPYAPLQLDPATAVLHYAQEIFEGMKAYRHADGSIWGFRPEENARRYARSAHRLALPTLSEEDFLASIVTLVRADAEWVPGGEDSSLYLRPFMFASEAFLGVRPANEVEHLVIASPVGPYFAGGVRPVSIYLSERYHRAGAPGGTGDAKFGGNYAASLLPQQEAAERGFDQVCFLDSARSTYLEELGGMNVFLVMADGTLHTPQLGSILEGITRKSVLKLAADRGHEVVERQIPVRELVDGIRSGEVKEFFACGTAAVITPIGRLASTDFDLEVNGGEPGELTMSLRQELTDIQYGRATDRHGWMTRLA